MARQASRLKVGLGGAKGNEQKRSEAKGAFNLAAVNFIGWKLTRRWLVADKVTKLVGGSTDPATTDHVRVNLLGRYMLADRREFPCQVVDMSPYPMRVAAPVSGAEGERVIVYADLLGRLEGTIDQPLQNGFCVTLAATIRKRDKLAHQLAGLAQARSPSLANPPSAEQRP